MGPSLRHVFRVRRCWRSEGTKIGALSSVGRLRANPRPVRRRKRVLPRSSQHSLRIVAPLHGGPATRRASSSQRAEGAGRSILNQNNAQGQLPIDQITDSIARGGKKKGSKKATGGGGGRHGSRQAGRPAIQDHRRAPFRPQGRRRLPPGSRTRAAALRLVHRPGRSRRGLGEGELRRRRAIKNRLPARVQYGANSS